MASFIDRDVGRHEAVMDWIVTVLVLSAGAYGLMQCAPGFRPKHLRDIAQAFFLGSRGWSALLFVAVYGLLLPAALRLKLKFKTASAVGGLIACLSLLLGLDIVIELGMGLSSGAAMWVLRLAVVWLSLWGLADKEARLALHGFPSTLARHWRGLGNAWWKLFAVLVGFFLFRQELHLYLTRGALTDDEIYFWYTGSVHLLEGGFEHFVRIHSYTPSLAWTIAFPARLLGLSSPEWLYGMPHFIFVLYVAFLFDVSRKSRELLAGVVLLFFVFLANRDLMALFVGSLYGEAPAALLTAVLFHAAYLRGRGDSSASLGLLLGFSILSKPPLSILCLIFLPLIVGGIAWSKRAKGPGLVLREVFSLLLTALGPYFVWKHALALRETTAVFAFSLQTLLHGGVDLGIPLRMIAGLLDSDAPQQAYTLGLMFVILFAVVLRNGRFLAYTIGLILVYWGFVFGLYATLWQATETGSAGRYCAHAALACVLCLPLVFQGKNIAATTRSSYDGA